MGIRGLESLLEGFYTSEHSSKIFTQTKLKDLRLVIDGNQFAYILSNIYQSGLYGGNYDYFYENVKKLLGKLKSSIEIVIFDGGRENINKSMKRLENKVAYNANISTSPGRPVLSDVEYLQNLRECPALFNKMILFKVLNELNINYAMAESLADHVIAAYASGKNPSKQKFTVMSKASFFNVYNLDGGYLCSAYVMKKFEKVDCLNEDTEFGVFHLKKLLKHVGFESQLTWIYFCILMGNRDDADLSRNINYFKEHKISTKESFDNLLEHMKDQEKKLIDTNFKQIRNTYRAKVIHFLVYQCVY